MSAKNLFRALIASPFVSERSAPDKNQEIVLSSLIEGGTEVAANLLVNEGYSATLRVQKGTPVDFFFIPAIPRVYWAKFIRTVGGGVKRLLSQVFSAFSRAEVVYA